MLQDRQSIENRILEILTYLDEKTLAYPLKQNIDIFSIKELEQLLEFLEWGKIEIIYKFLDDKYKEYLWLMEEIKMIKINMKKQEKLSQENKEREEESIELENLINF